HSLARLEHSFEPVARSVALRFLPHDQEREARRERSGCCQSDRPELGSREPLRVGLDLRDGRRDPVAERLEELGSGLEAVLVEVVARALARAQEEVAFEVRVLPQRAAELVVRQRLAASRTPCASGSSCSASGEPSTSETIEPSS